MEKRTQGAWLISHTNKLQEVKGSFDFEDIELAGKCGLFLSNLSASDEQSALNKDKVSAIAKVSNIKKTEIETIKSILKDASLIDVSSNGSVSVLGITTSSVLTHTSDLFENSNPSNFQKAAIDLSDNISDLPKNDDILKEYISDNYKLSNTETRSLFTSAEEIGFIDYEEIDSNKKLYFNGNLFRRDNANKINAVLSSLKPEDNQKILELDQHLTTSGCVTEEFAKNILGNQLMNKLQAIGMYDINQVSNSKEAKIFITKPSAFNKYGNPFEEDALDLAKAFVSSLYYGIKFSSQGRGKISMLNALLTKLVRGYEVGPATAIGEDYKLLELKRVIQLREDLQYPNRFHMKLLKKDIGLLAMQVLEVGDTSEQVVLGNDIYSGSVTNYTGPEHNRQVVRKRQNSQSKESVTELLRTFRN